MSQQERIASILNQVPEMAQQAAEGRLDPKAARAESEPLRVMRGILSKMHAADVADLLEGLPFGQRLLLWALLPKRRHGEVLLEVSEGVLERLVDEVGDKDLAGSFKRLDASEVAYILRRLPDDERARLMRVAKLTEDTELRASLSFGEEAVGSIMDFQPVMCEETMTVGQISSRLRKRGRLPSHCDKLFVTGDRGRLAGVLPLKRLLTNAKDLKAHDAMVWEDVYSFRPTDPIKEVAGAFERYDLISAPVVNAQQQVIGRITIDEIVEYLGERESKGMMISAGISGEEDLFAPIRSRFRNRWLWLLVNMVAAFAVSRMVGAFEEAIEKLVALAALMPIIASLSGNAGVQTSTLIVRALALRHVNRQSVARMVLNEMLLGMLSGVVAGLIAAGFGFLFYQSVALSLLLLVSMVSAFAVASLAGFVIPLIMDAMGKDPALGTTVVLTVITDCASFFVFLGLAALFLT